MKKDPLSLHREAMAELHNQFAKKTQYYAQKGFLELKDVYWLMHEFFNAFLHKDHHFTEEEILAELKDFKHEFIVLAQDTLTKWNGFFQTLSRLQYAGHEPSQDDLRGLVRTFSNLVDETIGREAAPADEFTRHVQATRLLVVNNERAKAEESYKRLMQEYDTFSAEKKRLHYAELEKLYQAIAALRSA